VLFVAEAGRERRANFVGQAAERRNVTLALCLVALGNGINAAGEQGPGGFRSGSRLR
jgi:hypothetical protein